MSPGCSSGARNCSTHAIDEKPLMGPSSTSGASRPWLLSAQTNIVVCQWPQGAYSRQRAPGRVASLLFAGTPSLFSRQPQPGQRLAHSRGPDLHAMLGLGSLAQLRQRRLGGQGDSRQQ